MAEGVENAVLFIPLITSKYATSPNCRRECELAATKGKLIKPIVCEKVETGWLSVCIAGLLQTRCLNHQITDSDLTTFITEVGALIPNDSPARAPNLSIYLSYSSSDKVAAEKVEKWLANSPFEYVCVMSARERAAPGDPLQKSADLEKKITHAKAIILLLSNNFVASAGCNNEVSLSYCHRKLIIPVLIDYIKEYPPKGYEFALRDVECLNFSGMFTKSQKVPTMSRKLLEAINRGPVSKKKTSLRNEDFLIKNVGKWTETDVENWLNHIDLSQYVETFKAKHVNGRVLLSLKDSDLGELSVMQLHQRRFYAAVSTLFTNLQWSEDEVAEWMHVIGLGELAQHLFKAHINGQSLLMLTDKDLHANGITDSVTQKRLMDEVRQLKETEARVPPRSEFYRFKLLQKTLTPLPSDATDENCKFSAEVVGLLRYIFKLCSDGSHEGLTQAGMKKYLLTLLAVAGIYRHTYTTKSIWTDLNVVEVYYLKALAKTLVDDLDNMIHNIQTQADTIIHCLNNNMQFRINCFNQLVLDNILAPKHF